MLAYDRALEMLNGALLPAAKPQPIIGVPKPFQTTRPPGVLAEVWGLEAGEDEEDDGPLDLVAVRPRPVPLRGEELKGDWCRPHALPAALHHRIFLAEGLRPLERRAWCLVHFGALFAASSFVFVALLALARGVVFSVGGA